MTTVVAPSPRAPAPAPAYGGLECAWPYQDIQETELGAASDLALSSSSSSWTPTRSSTPARCGSSASCCSARSPTRRGARGRGAVPPGPPISGRALVLLAVAISVATIVVRPLFPLTSALIGQVKLFRWPQFAAMFALVIVAARRGGLIPVPDAVRRRAGLAALVGVLAFFDLRDRARRGRRRGRPVRGRRALGHRPARRDRGAHRRRHLGLAARRRPAAPRAGPGTFGRAMSRSAYAAFLLQGVVLLALRPIDVPAEVKAVTAAGLGVAGSFALAWMLVARTPLGRVL